jgi:hypothetical protein
MELVEQATALAKDSNPVELARERESLLQLITKIAVKSLSDLDQAIELHEDALRLAEEQPLPDSSHALGSAGYRFVNLLFRRSYIRNNRGDLECGIRYGESILREARFLKEDSNKGRRILDPEDIQEVARVVGTMLVDKFKICGDPVDLDKAAKLPTRHWKELAQKQLASPNCGLANCTRQGTN